MDARRQIIATGITNLTDARYFSAMGVDWMGFDLKREPRISGEQMHAIMDWVEGPHWLVEVGESGDGIPEGISAVVHPPGHHPASWIGRCILTTTRASLAEVSSPKEQQDGILVELQDHQGSGISELVQRGDRQLWIRADWTTELLQQVLTSVPEAGIVMAGSSESAVGIKDYERMDQLIEQIREAG